MPIRQLVFCVLPLLVAASCQQHETPKTTTNAVTTDTNAISSKGPSQSEWLAIIRSLEDSMYKSEQLNPRVGHAAIKAYTSYQEIYWKDTLCADFLFKAAEIADNLENPVKAIALYQQCHDQYQMFPFRAECLFRIGNIYEYKLNDFNNAKDYYNDVIKFFPKSPMVESAKAALKNMGKSDADLIREFEKKNGVVRQVR